MRTLNTYSKSTKLLLTPKLSPKKNQHSKHFEYYITTLLFGHNKNVLDANKNKNEININHIVTYMRHEADLDMRQNLRDRVVLLPISIDNDFLIVICTPDLVLPHV